MYVQLRQFNEGLVYHRLRQDAEWEGVCGFPSAADHCTLCKGVVVVFINLNLKLIVTLLHNTVKLQNVS